ncbi:MAG: hypothetical protein AABZ08_00835 [Planctomycetota bacterium]
MCRGKNLSLTLTSLLAFAAVANAQNQPWQFPNGAVESRVQTCTAPQPLNRVAMDDFQFAQTTTLRWVRWWGVVFNPAQLNNRSYYVAIYSSGNGPCPAPCNPTVIQAPSPYCLVPSVTAVGQDCNGRTVYRFTACLPAPFVALGGTKYWLQISENNSNSATAGEDFRWSGYRDIHNCPAQQRDAAGVVACTINDDCPQPIQTDLSYVLRRTCFGGVIVIPPVILAPHVFFAEIRPIGAPDTSPPIYRQPLTVDSGGEYSLDEADLPDGQYTVTLVGMGMPHFKQPLNVINGVGTSSFFDIFVGDLNNDGMADGGDTQLFVNGLLHP